MSFAFDNPLSDTVMIPSVGGKPRELKGPEIKQDPESRKFGIGWYK